jgi:hypothetical protein
MPLHLPLTALSRICFVLLALSLILATSHAGAYLSPFRYHREILREFRHREIFERGLQDQFLAPRFSDMSTFSPHPNCFTLDGV